MPEPAAPFSATPPTLTLGAGEAAYGDAVTKARDEGWAERLFAKDPSLWSSDQRVQQAISERLGWLDAPEHFTDRIAALEGFGEGARDAGFTTAIVAGMGGSSLAPDVLARTFGADEDWLSLRVLDSTDPAAVAATVDDLDPLETLFIVASKSGTTTEPLAFLADAWARIGYRPEDSAEVFAEQVQHKVFPSESPMARYQGGSFMGIGPFNLEETPK